MAARALGTCLEQRTGIMSDLAASAAGRSRQVRSIIILYRSAAVPIQHKNMITHPISLVGL